MESETVHPDVHDTSVDWEFGYAVGYINDPQWRRRPGRYRVRTVAETAGPVTGCDGADHYREQAVVTDGPLTTAGPRSAVDFAHGIFRVLDTDDAPVTFDAWYALYRHQDARPLAAMMAGG